ncbi:MAG: hypothetical protein WBH35_02840 [Bacillota bacterium]|jgi:ABC-type transport system involved in multi-copper enzyme maturation permease subunit|nr:hypothetical protein [Bacillota bacterium]
MSKLISYFRVNRSIELFVFPVLLLAGTLMTISLSDKVEMRNMAGFMFLLPPCVYISAVAKVFTLEFKEGCWELMSTYPEKRWVVFCFKFLLSALILAIPLLASFLLLHSRVVPSPDLDLTFSSLVLLTIILACFTGNIALLVGLISRRYEISLIAGIVALAVITRIGVPKWVEYGLMPGVGSLCLALSFWLYLTLGGTADANRG